MSMGPATRRQFLKTMSAVSLGGAAGFAANLAGFNAYAAETDGYKALVCVFLFGGLDCHDTVIPHDQQSYNAWADIRAPLIGPFAGSRDRGALLPLSGANLGGRTFALPPEFAGLHDLWADGRLAVVGNVGPLIEPMNREAFRSGAGVRPSRLFSHNDQQSTWMASEPEGAEYGWGGRIADVMLGAGANPQATFTAVSAAGNAVFLSGEQVRQFQVGRNGAVSINSTSGSRFLGSTSLPTLFDDHFRDLAGVDNLFERDTVDVSRFALEANDDLSFALDNSTPTMTEFPETNLASQLSIVARMIAQRQLLNVGRQVFFVSTGGFDTHSDQATRLPDLQAQISGAIKSFYDTMVELGVEDSVTTFTASDFGRTLRINGDGTDHGWGGHHVVVGGAVNGGQILGGLPETAFDHSQDSGRGRLIPEVSVDQYAGALGRWFGLNESEIREALPGYGNFDSSTLASLMIGGGV